MTQFHWIMAHLNVGTGSVAIAFLSALIAVLSAYWAIRSARATDRNAKAAEDQAAAARGQLLEAQQASWHSQEAYKLSMIENARNRAEQLSPQPIIAFEIAVSTSLMKDMPFEGSRNIIETPDELDFWKNRWNWLGVVVRGVLINDSDKAMRVRPFGIGIRFIQGRTRLADQHVEHPVAMQGLSDIYLIEAREKALFEWDASCSVDNWIDIYEGREPCIPVHAGFNCYPVSHNDVYTSAEMKVSGSLVFPTDEKNKWRTQGYDPPIHLDYDRKYTTDIKRLRAELTQEPDSSW
jgi:hypothetical protein